MGSGFLPLLTSMFLHGGWLHLIANMWVLWIFGDDVEDPEQPHVSIRCSQPPCRNIEVAMAGSPIPHGACGQGSGTMAGHDAELEERRSAAASEQIQLEEEHRHIEGRREWVTNGVVNRGVSSRSGTPVRPGFNDNRNLMDAALAIDKPEGMTLHDVVDRVRGFLRNAPSGILALLRPDALLGSLRCWWAATRASAQFFDKADKSYEGEIRLGFSTGEKDATG